MSDQYFMGYKVNTGIKHFLPNTVLFTKNDEKITASMAQDAVDYILGVLAQKNPLIDTYKKAKTVFSAIKLILENKQPSRVTKEDVKAAIDVIEEIQNLSAKSEAEKEYNARYALLCKLLVDGLDGIMV
ncbi:hypothetical protein [Mordavella massiliensis]|uniref:hypothetical protein n=1 Tax=Mordavella massiliensis TaxID=1871024 RepID=UPI002109B2F1|nr:hypothetical protein [Mordavella massiliensis]